MGHTTGTGTTIAGIPVPDSSIARDATGFVHDVSTQLPLLDEW